MDDNLALEALRWMMLSRHYDRRAISLQRQGRFGIFAPVSGQEASVVGSAFALDRQRDWIVPQYREAAALAKHGYGYDKLTANYLGKYDSGRIPDDVLVLPNQTALAAQLPHAVGLAWGMKILKRDAVVLTYVGEGGSSEGDFHEALNLAGVVEAPIIFILQNNQWAISTPRYLQSRASSLAARAVGYGFPGVQVDGNDLFAVYAVTRDAVARARSGAGPTLIESLTYRIGFHNTTDDPSRYRNADEVRRAQDQDPVRRVQLYLTGRGLWNEQVATEYESSVSAEVDAAIESGFQAEEPQWRAVFDHVYVTPPERFLSQRRLLESEVAQDA